MSVSSATGTTAVLLGQPASQHIILLQDMLCLRPTRRLAYNNQPKAQHLLVSPKGLSSSHLGNTNYVEKA